MPLSARHHSERIGRDVVDDGGVGRDLAVGRRASNQEAPSVDVRRAQVVRGVELREPVGPGMGLRSAENAVVLPTCAGGEAGSTGSMPLRLSVTLLLRPTYGAPRQHPLGGAGRWVWGQLRGARSAPKGRRFRNGDSGSLPQGMSAPPGTPKRCVSHRFRSPAARL